MITRIEPANLFIPECGVAGEQRRDGAWPAMADTLQLSRDRWLVLFSTRGFLGRDEGFTGSDNDRSIVYQVRKDGPTGPVIVENALKKFRDDWDVLQDGRRNLMQHCHTGGFGVPMGALVGGRRVPHENVFVASWYRTPRTKGAGPDAPGSHEYAEALQHIAFCIEWVQFRLKDDGSDIEILQPPRQLRQKGFEGGPVFCDMAPPCRMNKWYVKPAPFTADLAEWVQVAHFEYGLAAIRYRFNAETGLYEWAETGPLLKTGRQDGLAALTGNLQLTETSTLRWKDSWLILARSAERLSKTVRGVAWIRTDDLFKPLPAPVLPGEPLSKSPCSAFVCPDGILRLFTNDPKNSPYGNDRNPLYCWDVDPDRNFEVANRRVVFDAEVAGLRVRDDTWFRVDMPNLFPHAGGREQTVACRVRLRSRKAPHTRLVEEERTRTGLYATRLVYDDVYPAAWEFAPT